MNFHGLIGPCAYLLRQWNSSPTSSMPKRNIQKPPKKNVRWGEVVVYEFPNILGDNPAVSGGVPLTIAWKHVAVNTHSVDYNDFLRLEKPRRKRKDLVLSSAQRDTVSTVTLSGLSFCHETTHVSLIC